MLRCDPATTVHERVLWSDDADMPPADAGALPESADVVVVGGGYSGAAAARELALGGRQPILIEQGPLGSGASARNGGFAHAGLRRSPAELNSRFGGKLGDELYRETIAAFDHLERLVEAEPIDCRFTACGYLRLAERPRQAERLRRAHASLVKAGHDATFLGRDEVVEHSGSSRHIAGLLLEGAASVQPARLLAGLLRAARRAGARLHGQTTVTGLDRAGRGVEVRTTRGPIQAGHVFMATDGYTAGLLPFLRPRIIPIDSFIIATEPLTPELQSEVSPRGHVCAESKNFLCYWRLLPDGRLMFGGRASFAPTSEARASVWLREQMLAIYPSLEGVEIEAAWGGKTGFSRDQLPHVGRVGDITYAVTYCGSGVALAPWLGTRAARWILGEEPPAFARIPFPAVPLYRGRPWFLPLVGSPLALMDRL
jgi:glycine/D-amino acid oxidase-like deaminating enzyme